MELEYFGGNCFRLRTKTTVIVVDDNLSSLGKKSILNDKSVAFYTQTQLKPSAADSSARLVIDTPGEFEVGDVTVTGLQVRAHTDEEGAQTATVYQFMHGNNTVTLVGHIHPELSAELTELISGTDVMVIPVGGNGYTLDPIGAASVIKKTEPHIVIPSQYELKQFNYEVPAQPLEEFTKVMAVPADSVEESLKISKVSEESGSQLRIIQLAVK